MKKKASFYVKNIISVLSSIVKGKITGVKEKAVAIRIRLMVFSLMKSKKFSLSTLSNKIQALLDKSNTHKLKDEEEDHDDHDQNRAIILYDHTNMSTNECNYVSNDHHELVEKRELIEYYGNNGYYDHNYDDDKYPDLTHSLFDEDDEDDGGSIIDMVKNSKENEGKDFKLEDDIDHVADLFIKRFRRQILLQKLDSFKRIQELLGRSG
ncbi:uncharacterized protein LOC130802475 [Amaranthus tricolor]|uniref:uncharacterized protein LOC130802475 n=1 Tax=Amaranthus tricolor TaxID=29722 RepID=UPI00258FF763|nr:uncharacterized protein LOC130802475 [Amaranthus tricolor]